MENSFIDFKAQYIRTNGFHSGVAYPVIAVISSAAELEEYAARYWGKDGLPQPVPSGKAAGFLDPAGKYTDEFFLDSFLVIVLLEETSGSIRHRVESVGANGEIVIRRLLPEIGTCDMAEWNIIVELENRFKPQRFQAVFLDKMDDICYDMT